MGFDDALSYAKRKRKLVKNKLIKGEFIRKIRRTIKII